MADTRSDYDVSGGTAHLVIQLLVELRMGVVSPFFVFVIIDLVTICSCVS